jgi:hypothetical protein
MRVYEKGEPTVQQQTDQDLDGVAMSGLTAAGHDGGAIKLHGRRWPQKSLRFHGRLELNAIGEREAALLLLVCFLDMMTTLWWVSTGLATESNPLLQWTFAVHPVAFVLVKLLTFAPAIYLAVRLAQRYPDFTVGLMRLVLIAYVLLYGYGITHV